MECINLQQQFDTRYRITFDTAYDPRNRPKDRLDPWMMQIPCQRGVIYTHGGNLLAVEVDGRPRTAQRLQDTDLCTLHLEGDTEKTFMFDLANFDTVASIVKPRRKRRMTPTQKQAAAERLETYRFKKQPRSPEQLTGPPRASDTSA